MGSDAVDERLDNHGRRRFLTATTAVVGAVGAGSSRFPSSSRGIRARAAKLAGAPVEADISELEPGQRMVLEWRGKPVWIVKRTQADARRRCRSSIRACRSEVDQRRPAARRTRKNELPLDQAGDLGAGRHLHAPRLLAGRFVAEIKPEPFDPDWKGGFFCPCHESRFDLAGRVFKGVPAPTNLAGAAAQVRDRHARSSSASTRKELRKPWRT